MTESSERTYLDHAATTPLRAEALEAMMPLLSGDFGNPSGLHATARRARRLLDDAREQMAETLGCADSEVVFTSGGTEADNLALAGARARAGRAVVVSAVEHHAVLETAAALDGIVSPVTADGAVDLDRLGELLGERPAGGGAGRTIGVVSVMTANNETGVVQPLHALVKLVAELAPPALVHTDAVQGFPWCDVAAMAAGCDLVSVSAHKFGGPKGVGALVVRRRARPLVAPLLHGGGQERGLRPGTENVAGIVGMAAAARATVAERSATVERVAALRDRLADGLLASRPGVREVAPRDTRVAGSCLLAFEDVEGEELCYLLDEAGVEASTGSACASGAREPSHVLTSMGWSRAEARSVVRLSLGRTTTGADVERVLAVLPPALDRLRGQAG